MAVAGLLAPATPALALLDDRLEVFAGTGITHDDNVFRIAPETDPATVLGSPSRGDSYRTHVAGLKLDLPLGRQRIAAELSFNQYRYDRFDVLDLDGHHARAAWHWQAGKRLNGRLGFADTKSLASLANVQSGIQSSTPNFLETTQELVDATYRLTPRWELRGEVHTIRHDNSAAEYSVSDARIDQARLELRYIVPGGSRIGIGLHRADGDLPNPQLVAGLPVDNSYRHEAAEAFVEWMAGSRARVSVGAGPMQREFRDVTARDFDDWAWRVAFDWLPTDKLQIGASLVRDVSTAEEVNVGFVLSEGPVLTATWKPRDKLDVTLRLQSADREYLGDASIAQGLVPARTEKFKSASATITWRPRRALTVELKLRHDRRDSTVVEGDYEATVAGIGIRVGF